jgi:hypothetical protein
MKITKHLKGLQDMNKMQADLGVANMKKKDQQDQMEPLQDLSVEVIAQTEEAKKNIVQTWVECTEMIREDVTMQLLDALKEKAT